MAKDKRMAVRWNIGRIVRGARKIGVEFARDFGNGIRDDHLGSIDFLLGSSSIDGCVTFDPGLANWSCDDRYHRITA
jgi:hypothetical protein